jgi:hypothetical protein
VSEDEDTTPISDPKQKFKFMMKNLHKFPMLKWMKRFLKKATAFNRNVHHQEDKSNSKFSDLFYE